MIDRRQITPVLLTYNEEANLDRTLGGLVWAERVVILDSGSTDQTRAIAGRYPNTAWFERPFDNHKAQWTYAIRQTGITTPYVLALDADMIAPAGFIEEAEAKFSETYAGGIVPFRYAVGGRCLMGSIYPAQLRVFRKDDVVIEQVGHTQVFSIAGPVYHFEARVLHDDRKPLERWIREQLRYSQLETDRIGGAATLRLKDRLRKSGMMPLVAGLLGYLRAGGPLRGKASLRYGLERMTFENLVAIRLINASAPGSSTTNSKTD